MKRILFLILSLAVGLECMATDIKGRVIDQNKAAVAYATVAVERGKTPIKAISSSENGEFVISVADGKYRLEITAVGYAAKVLPVVLEGKSVDLGDVVLEQGVAVNAVAVTVQKPIVISDAEKLTYSVEDDPEAKTSTLEEILRKIPQISIDADGTIRMNGQTSFKVLVNGRESMAFSMNLKEMVKAVPASSIKKVEVITNPSVKYDAEGVGGILNIELARVSQNGYNGNVAVQGTTFFSSAWGTNNSANFNLHKDKVSFGVSASLNAMNSEKEDFQRQELNMTSRTLSDFETMQGFTEIGNAFKSFHVNANVGYQIDDRNLINFEFSGWDGSWKMNSDREATYFSQYSEHPDKKVRNLQDYEKMKNPWGGVSANIAYEHSFKGENHKLTISDQVYYCPSQDGYRNLLSLTDIPAETRSLMNYGTRKRSYGNSLQVDYTNTIKKLHTIEAGMKFSGGNERKFDDLLFGEDKIQLQSDLTRYTKNVLGVYAGYSFNYKNLAVRAGGRFEAAWYWMATETGLQDNGLYNAIPYVSFTYRIKGAHALSLSYTERLSRPGVSQLSPFVETTGASKEYGNPDLESTISHRVALAYSLMTNKWGVSFEARTLFSNNNIAEYTFLDTDGYWNKTYTNGSKYRTYGGLGTLYYRPSAKFNMSLSCDFSWNDFRIQSTDSHTTSWSLTQTFNANVALWKGGTFTAGEYLLRPGNSSELAFRNYMVFYSAGIVQKFLGDALTLSVKIQNPFNKTTKVELLYDTPSYRMSVDNYQLVRSLQVGLSYAFGKRNVKSIRAARRVDDSGEFSQGKTSNGMGF